MSLKLCSRQLVNNQDSGVVLWAEGLLFGLPGWVPAQGISVGVKYLLPIGKCNCCLLLLLFLRDWQPLLLFFFMLISFRTELTLSDLTHIYWTWLLLAVKGVCAQNTERLSGHSSRGEWLRRDILGCVELAPLKWVKHEWSWASFEGKMLLWIAVAVLLRMPRGLKALL